MRHRLLALLLFAACTSPSAPTGHMAPGDMVDAGMQGSGAGSNGGIGSGGLGSGSGSSAPADAPLASSAAVTTDGTPRTPTYLVAHYTPFSQDIGVHVRVDGLDGTSFDDVIVHFPADASGDVSDAASVIVQLPSGDQLWSPTRGNLAGASVGPIGGYIDGALSATLTNLTGSTTMDLDVSWHIVRDADSDLL